VYLDGSERFREAAISAGREHKQKVIRNSDEDEEIRLDGEQGLAEQRIAGMRQIFMAPRVVCSEWLDPDADNGRRAVAPGPA